MIEAIGVAVDQWFGHRADPASDVATPHAHSPVSGGSPASSAYAITWAPGRP